MGIAIVHVARLAGRLHVGDPLAERCRVRVVVGLALLCLLAAPGTAVAQISLVGALDPFPGDDVYGDVWGEGDHAYIGTHLGTGVGIVDISDPAAPVLVKTYDAGAGVHFKDVKVHGGIGYFAGEAGGGLHIVDLSDPAAPVLLSHVTAVEGGHASVHNVFVANGFAYEADSRTPTLVVFDVGDPAAPVYVRDIVTPDTVFIHDVTVIGNRLYASGWGGFTYIYDVTDVGNAAPALLGTVPTGIQSHSSWATSDNGLLISAQEISNGDIKIFDVTNPAAPILLSSLDRTSLGIDAFTPHNPFLYDDTLLFVAWYEAGVVAIDLSDPANPVLVGNYDTFPGGESGGGGNWGVYPLLGLGRVLLSDMDAGLVIVDATPLGLPAVPSLPWPAGLLLGGLLVGAGRVVRWRGGPQRRSVGTACDRGGPQA
jgi:choice-of-anchor B domain-containing protein